MATVEQQLDEFIRIQELKPQAAVALRSLFSHSVVIAKASEQEIESELTEVSRLMSPSMDGSPAEDFTPPPPDPLSEMEAVTRLLRKALEIIDREHSGTARAS